MSEKVKNPGLNAEDLKSRLYQSLHSSGLLKKLKVFSKRVYDVPV